MVNWRLSEQDKSFLQALAYGIGVVLFWKGIWEGTAEIPIIGNPWVSLFLGLAILSLTGWIFGQFDVFSMRASKLQNILDNVMHEAKKGIMNEVYYFDELTGKHVKIPVHTIKKIEAGHLVIHGQNREQFIPLHRISHVKHGSKVLWHSR
jgi:uncharacterized protein (UPF0248 family)